MGSDPSQPSAADDCMADSAHRAACRHQLDLELAAARKATRKAFKDKLVAANARPRATVPHRVGISPLATARRQHALMNARAAKNKDSGDMRVELERELARIKSDELDALDEALERAVSCRLVPLVRRR